MSWPVTIFLCLPCLLGALTLMGERVVGRLPPSQDDLWRLPRPSSLRD
ncbi:hypothetical protein [Methylobacterium sp. A54F]